MKVSGSVKTVRAAPVELSMKKSYLALSLMAATLFVSACGDDNKATASTETPLKTVAPAASADAEKVKAVADSSSDNDQAIKAANSSSISADSAFEDKVSYAVGVSVGTYIATIQREQQEFIGDLKQDLVIKGFIDALNSNTALTDKEITDTLVALDTKVREGIQKKQEEAAQKNLDDGKKFLEDNAKKDGVKVTESGLQYEILQEGTGKTPTATDVVRVKYKGTTIDGQVFDEQQEPIAFPLANIIPGWTEGLQLMKEGGKARLVIPADLAYGEVGAGELIKPNSVLVFEIELVEVLPPAEEAAESAPAETTAQ